MFGRVMLLLFCAVLLISAATAVSARQSIYGPTGLVFMPTAEAAGQRELCIFYNYVDAGSGINFYGINLGIVNGLEVGATIVSNSSSDTIFNAKYVLPLQSYQGAAIAVGALNITGTGEGDAAPYIVMSSKLSRSRQYNLNGHIGYIFGDINSIMIGADIALTPQLKIIADWVDDATEFSYGVSFMPAANWDITAAMVDDDFTAGISYKLMMR